MAGEGRERGFSDNYSPGCVASGRGGKVSVSASDLLFVERATGTFMGRETFMLLAIFRSGLENWGSRESHDAERLADVSGDARPDT